MTNRYPLIIDAADGNKIKELPAGDNLNLLNNSIQGVQDITALGTIDAAIIRVAGQRILAQTFTDLSDTPNNYTGAASSFVKVNSAGTALEFADLANLGDITVENVTVENGNIEPAADNTGQLGTASKKFTQIHAVDVYSNLRGRDGSLVFDASNNRIPYAAIFGAPAALSEFTNDMGFLDAAGINEAIADAFAGTSLDTDLNGSVFADDSTLLVDGVNASIPYSVLSGAPAIPTDIADLTDTTNLLGGGGANNNIWVQTFETATPATDVPQVATSVEYDSDGNIIALFSHINPVDNTTYYSVGKYTTTGTRIWTTRFADDFNTDGWGLAVDNAGGVVYIAGDTNADGGQNNATLTKISGTTGLVEWSKIYDFGYSSFSSVVDVTSDGDPVMVGYASNGDDRYVATTKVDQTDGSVIWSRALDGQNDEEAYGMAVGPSGEVVAVGYMDQLGVTDAAATLSVDPVSNPLWTVGGSITFSEFTVDFTFADGIPTFTNLVDSEGGRTVDGIITTVLGSTIGGADGVDDMVVKVATLAANDTDDRMLVVKYAANGTIAWQKAIQFDENFDCSGADADIDSQGNIYVCGQYSADNVGPIGQLMSIVKFNSSGVKQWSRRVVGNCGQWSSSIVVGADDHLYLSATTFTGTDSDDLDIHLVLAKYEFDGTVAWQRLLDYTAGYSFGTNFFGSDIGGSNLAVKQDYVAVSLGFGSAIFEGPGSVNAAVAQIPATGDIFTVGSWDFKAASFSGNLDDTASDITVVNAGKTDYDNIANISTTAVTLEEDSSNFLVGTLYTAPGGDNSLVNGAYTVTLENTGTLTLPAGGTITEGVVTSNPTIQLTPATPDVASQKLVIKGGGAYNYTDNGININYYTNTAIVGDTLTFYINSPTYADQTLYWWIYPEGAGISDPGSGTVALSGASGSFSFVLDSDDNEFTVRVSPEDNNYDPANIGIESGLINPDAPTFDSEHHLHLTTGNLAETSIFLGTDDHNVRTTVNGGVEINTFLYPSGGGSGKWTFSENGDLTFPDATVQTTAYIPGDIQSEEDISIRINLSDSTQRVWRFGEDGDLTFPDSTVQTTALVQGEQTFIVDYGNTDYAPTAVDFNLLFVTPAIGYSDVTPTSVTLPNGVPGQRLVIFNGYSLATLTVNPGPVGRDISSGVIAEFIYSGFDGLWIPLYGTNSPT